MTLPTWATEKAREIVSHAWRVPVATALIEAERRGAERMREMAARCVEKRQTNNVGMVHPIAIADAAAIRTLPLDEES